MTNPAADAVEELLQVLGWLTANLLHGTHRPFRPPPSADHQAERDRAAALERLLDRRNEDRSGMLVPLGETPAPMVLDVADMIAEISDAADEMAALVSVAAQQDVPPPARYAFTDPRPYLRRVLELLPEAPAVWESVESRCDGLLYRAYATLGVLGDGQLLPGMCPWCDGRTERFPVGGARTLRVRAVVPDGRKLTDTTLDQADIRWLVVCENRWCEPPEADCGNRHRGRPAWPLATEGAWLADRIEYRAVR